MSHYYTTLGEPMHFVPKARGKGDRPTTIRDARKLNLIPSVTSILSINDKPGLNNWKLRTALADSFANRPFANETEQQFVARISDMATRRGEAIMDFGTAIHNAIEQALSGKDNWNQSVTHPQGYEHQLAEFVNPVLELFTDNKWRAVDLEKVLIGDGYAGTSDCIYIGDDEYGIIDFKTTADATKDERDLVRLEYPTQIALYHMAEHGFIGDKAVGYNIFISRDTNIGAVKAVRYDAERLRAEYEFGMRCVLNWQHINNHKPEIKSKQ